MKSTTAGGTNSRSQQDRPGLDTSTAAGHLVFGIFAALAEFERELIRSGDSACSLNPASRAACASRSAGEG